MRRASSVLRSAHLHVEVYLGFTIRHIGNVVRASVRLPCGCLCSAKSSAGSAHESLRCSMITMRYFLIACHFAKRVPYQVKVCKFAPGARRGCRNRCVIKECEVPPHQQLQHWHERDMREHSVEGRHTGDTPEASARSCFPQGIAAH